MPVTVKACSQESKLFDTGHDTAKKALSYVSFFPVNSGLLDSLGFAEMILFHGNSPAARAHVFHGGKLLFANVGMIHIGRAAEAAL